MQATGIFDVKLSPQESHASGTDGTTLGRLGIDKTFHGDLEATSVGDMLSARTAMPGSAAYVAIEQVSGRLGDRAGSFVLVHYGAMKAGAHQLTLEVVPDSGTGELAGLAGSMTIEIEDGVHRYAFAYDFLTHRSPA